MLTTYLILSTVIFGVLFVVWSSKSNLNIVMKLIFLGTFILGLLTTLVHLGYVLKH